MFYRLKSYGFTAQHSLTNEKLSEFENANAFGKCVNPHGHDYMLRVCVSGKPNPTTNKLLVEHKFDEIVQKVLEGYDYKVINELESFRDKIPTSEVIVETLWSEIEPKIEALSKNCQWCGDSVQLYSLELRETSRNSFMYFGPEKL